MTTFLFFYMLLIHYIADFWLQTEQQAKLKSVSELYLTMHVATYALIWLIALMAVRCTIHWNVVKILFFVSITYSTHWIIDFFTSKASKYYFDKQDYHNGFVVIGFDQLLHYLQLFLTYKLLIKWP